MTTNVMNASGSTPIPVSTMSSVTSHMLLVPLPDTREVILEHVFLDRILVMPGKPVNDSWPKQDFRVALGQHDIVDEKVFVGNDSTVDMSVELSVTKLMVWYLGKLNSSSKKPVSVENLNPFWLRAMRPSQHGNLTVSDAFKILKRFGMASPTEFPGGDVKFKQDWTELDRNRELVQCIGRRHIDGYASIRTVHGLLFALNHCGPCVVTLPKYNDGHYWYLPDPDHETEQIRNHTEHTVLVAGWDPQYRWFILRDVRGPDWCTEGCTVWSIDHFGLQIDLKCILPPKDVHQSLICGNLPFGPNRYRHLNAITDEVRRHWMNIGATQVAQKFQSDHQKMAQEHQRQIQSLQQQFRQQQAAAVTTTTLPPAASIQQQQHVRTHIKGSAQVNSVQKTRSMQESPETSVTKKGHERASSKSTLANAPEDSKMRKHKPRIRVVPEGDEERDDYEESNSDGGSTRHNDNDNDDESEDNDEDGHDEQLSRSRVSQLVSMASSALMSRAARRAHALAQQHSSSRLGDGNTSGELPNEASSAVSDQIWSMVNKAIDKIDQMQGGTSQGNSSASGGHVANRQESVSHLSPPMKTAMKLLGLLAQNGLGGASPDLNDPVHQEYRQFTQLKAKFANQPKHPYDEMLAVGSLIMKNMNSGVNSDHTRREVVLRVFDDYADFMMQEVRKALFAFLDPANPLWRINLEQVLQQHPKLNALNGAKRDPEVMTSNRPTITTSDLDVPPLIGVTSNIILDSHAQSSSSSANANPTDAFKDPGASVNNADLNTSYVPSPSSENVDPLTMAGHDVNFEQRRRDTADSTSMHPQGIVHDGRLTTPPAHGQHTSPAHGQHTSPARPIHSNNYHESGTNNSGNVPAVTMQQSSTSPLNLSEMQRFEQLLSEESMMRPSTVQDRSFGNDSHQLLASNLQSLGYREMAIPSALPQTQILSAPPLLTPPEQQSGTTTTSHAWLDSLHRSQHHRRF